VYGMKLTAPEEVSEDPELEVPFPLLLPLVLEGDEPEADLVADEDPDPAEDVGATEARFLTCDQDALEPEEELVYGMKLTAPEEVSWTMAESEAK
jgi:hypothetical protein